MTTRKMTLRQRPEFRAQKSLDVDFLDGVDFKVSEEITNPKPTWKKFVILQPQFKSAQDIDAEYDYDFTQEQNVIQEYYEKNVE